MRALPAAAFIASIGVNTHTAWRDKAYALPDGAHDVRKVERLLAYLGVTQIRDAFGAAWMLNEYRELGRAGIRLDLIVSHEQGAEPLASLVGELAAVAPLLIGIEGPNEADLHPEGFEGEHGPAAARALQKRLYALIRARPKLDGVPVLETSIGHPDALPNYAGIANADRNNMHSYFFEFNRPMASELATRLEQTRPVAPGKPVVTTETGWPTVGDPGGYVPEPVQAVMVLDDLLDQFKAGVLQTYVYQLIDEPESKDYYGLFTENGMPKPAAVALRNLIRILSDPKGGTRAGSLPLSVSGLPPTGATLLLEKADGSFWLVLWNGPPIWDAGGSRAMAVADAPVTVRATGMRRACVYDPLRGTSAMKLDDAAGTFAIAVSVHPLIMALHADADARCADPGP